MAEYKILSYGKEELEQIIRSALKDLISELLTEQSNNRYDADELIDQTKACMMLGVSMVTLWEWRRQGRLTFKKIGRRIYYSKNELLKIK